MGRNTPKPDLGKQLVALSGGMDSATVLGSVLHAFPAESVACVGFYYGSKHNAYENVAAREIAAAYKVPLEFINLEGVMSSFKSALLKTGDEIPEGHYEAESMRQTVVPGRNLIFISVLAGYAESLGFERIWLGIHAGDHHIYPDCRPGFFQNAQHAVAESTDSKIALRAPFLNDTKVGILKVGLELCVPYYLTRTCYKAQQKACGRCGSCQERLAAFQQLGVEDPIEYETRELLPRE